MIALASAPFLLSLPPIDWVGLLGYHEAEPMIFTRFFFWGFFALVLAGYSLVYRRMAVRNAYLFAVSLFFYWKTSGLFVGILLFSTFADLVIGLRIAGGRTQLSKQLWLALSITLNLLVLGYFKYAHFVVENLNAVLDTNFEVVNHFAHWANQAWDAHFVENKILLPVGISFFTFQTMSYAVDVYRGHLKPVRNLLDFGFYVSFFPQLVAGPIVRASEFIPQLYQEYRLTRTQFGIAVFWILNGLLKKMLIGDYIAVNFIDRVFADPLRYTGFENLMALYGYSLQLYAHFSRYTHIAIGVPLLMRFTLPLNFTSPYKARSVAEFWRRWHMSLSTWLRDYLYIPMGGNRGGSLFSYIMLGVIVLALTLLTGWLWLPVAVIAVVFVLYLVTPRMPGLSGLVNTNLNLMLTMLIGGLWHGASWMFVIWGGLNGLGLVVYKWWRKVSPWEKSSHWAVLAWRVLVTFTFITFTRIWFRGDSLRTASEILHQLTHDPGLALAGDVLLAFRSVFAVMAVGLIVHWLPEQWKEAYRQRFASLPLWAMALVCIAAVVLVYQSMSAEMVPFIYFQF